MRKKFSIQSAAILLGCAAFAFLPIYLGNYYIYVLSLIFINIILALGLNLLTGNSGQISLCHSSFMALGSYSFTLLNNIYGLNPFLSTAISLLFVAMMGFLVGFPARRLSGIYLALATLAFLALVQICIEEFADLTGGIRGLKLNKLNDFFYTSTFSYLVAWALCLISIYTAFQIMNSKLGRNFDAVRTSPYAAQALGISVNRVKLIAFTVCAAYAGLAGALLSWVVGYIDPVEFGVSASLRYITFIVIGGMGNIYGSILGAVVLTLLPEALRFVKEYSDLVYAALLLLSLIFMPKGLISYRQILKKNTVHA
jgi:branched-chain amino acid transport system permease protein